MSLTLTDASRVDGEIRVIISVNWCIEIGENCVQLSETIFAPNMSMSLLSIPAFMKKNIAEMFMPGKVVPIDFND